MPQSLMLKKLKLNGSMKTYETSRTNTKKVVLFIIGDWNAKVGSEEIPGVTGKFELGVQNEAGKRLTEFCQENSLVITNTLFQQHKRRLYTWMQPGMLQSMGLQIVGHDWATELNWQIDIHKTAFKTTAQRSRSQAQFRGPSRLRRQRANCRRQKHLDCSKQEQRGRGNRLPWVGD